MLELNEVTGAYGPIEAVSRLSLTVEAGSTLVVIGRNGAGKTTTLRLISGVIQPRAGTVSWMGESLGGTTPERRVKDGIVLVPEGRGVFPALSVDENLRMGAYSCRRTGRRAVAERLAWIYDVVPIIANRRSQLGGSLSGGEQQLLVIGRGLMANPRLLMLDEPSLGLSPLMTDTLYELLHQLKAEQIGLIVVEQYVHLALELCDKVLGLSNGEVAFWGDPDELVASGKLASLYMGGGNSEVERAIEKELTNAFNA